MKAIFSVILLMLLMSLIGCKPSLEKESDVDILQVITPFQQSMLVEINFARTNPVGYAELRLKAASGDSADNGSYLYMKNLAPLAPISFNNSLNISASNYALFLADKNLMGHDLNGTPLKRAITVGFEGSSIGENIAASSGDSFNTLVDSEIASINFVRIMIIDTGVADLGHRRTILNPTYRTVGIGYSRNPSSTFINYNVQDFGNL
ncbi:MAG: CAP domain-containing protein [Mariniphaga sp.]